MIELTLVGQSSKVVELIERGDLLHGVFVIIFEGFVRLIINIFDNTFLRIRVVQRARYLK
jgi:hypothetical protein